jgi:hypothetical protein
MVSTLKMDAICSVEMLATTYKTTRRHNPEDRVLVIISVAHPEFRFQQ